MHPLRQREIDEGAAETDRLLKISITAIGKELDFPDELLEYLLHAIIEAISPEYPCRQILLDIRATAQGMANEAGHTESDWATVLLESLQREGEAPLISAYVEYMSRCREMALIPDYD